MHKKIRFNFCISPKFVFDEKIYLKNAIEKSIIEL